MKKLGILVTALSLGLITLSGCSTSKNTSKMQSAERTRNYQEKIEQVWEEQQSSLMRYRFNYGNREDLRKHILYCRSLMNKYRKEINKSKN